jgi:hypothetical protein
MGLAGNMRQNSELKNDGAADIGLSRSQFCNEKKGRFGLSATAAE